MLRRVIRFNLSRVLYFTLMKLMFFIFRPVYIDRPQNVSLGKGTAIYPFVCIYILNPKGYLRTGRNCEINSFSVLRGGYGIEMGNDVLISPGVKINSSTNYYEPGWLIAENPHIGGKITIEDNVHIGANAVILPGVTIGSGSVIGAGSVVTHDIPPGVIAYGVPCRVRKQRMVKEGNKV